MNRNENKYKHLTLDERIEIQECLAKGMAFKAIARRIGKDPTAISKDSESPPAKTLQQLRKDGSSLSQAAQSAFCL